MPVQSRGDDGVRRVRNLLAPPQSNAIYTYSGRMVDVFRITPDDIDIGDIAHALALTNRFGGHSIVAYSVAQHSLAVSHLQDTTINSIWGLLHDSAETYLTDLASPIKRHECMAG